MQALFEQSCIQYLQSVGGSASWVAILDNTPPETRNVSFRTLKDMQRRGLIKRVVTKRGDDPQTQLYVDLVQGGNS